MDTGTVLRYVEANPVRAALTGRARDWPWSSRTTPKPAEAPATVAWPWPVPRNWDAQVDTPQPIEQLDAVRLALVRGVPLQAPASALDAAATIEAEGQAPLF